VNLQQIKRDLEEIKDAINPKTLRPDLSKVKEELKAKLNQIHERVQERRELPELTA
jgi:predicted nuclease with TOPRIM domain